MRGAALLLALLPAAALAQRPQGEAGVSAHWTADQVAWYGLAGATWPAGTYARLSAIGAMAFADPGRDARGDLVARVILDPYRRSRFGFSFGGGVSLGRSSRLLAVAEMEGPRWRGVSPALQAGIGGGWRAGIRVRGARPGRR